MLVEPFNQVEANGFKMDNCHCKSEKVEMTAAEAQAEIAHAHCIAYPSSKPCIHAFNYSSSQPGIQLVNCMLAMENCIFMFPSLSPKQLA